MNEETQNLSPEGESRREQILHLALRESRRRTIRRRTSRAAMICFMLLGIGWLTWRGQPSQSPIAPMSPQQIARSLPAPGPEPAQPTIQTVTLIRLQTDPTISTRLAMKIDRREWKTLGDRDFLQALADAGKPAAIVYQGGKASLMIPR